MASSSSGITLPAPSTTTFKVTPIPAPKLGSMPPHGSPESGAATSSAAATTSSAATASGPTAAVSYTLIPTVESGVPDASSGPHRDGRIRNPVPSKLKGKTDGSKGNFSVMHMDVAGRTEAAERDAEAKRTSESTELAAKRAYESGYVSLRKSRFIHIPDEPEQVAKPFKPPPAVAVAVAAAGLPAPTPVSAPAPPQIQHPAPHIRQTSLSPEETKSEQARLLTLLRSLHPVLVVDQICKALAFFGGIPGASPPLDGGFPQSAESNGPGSLFVGWIAEIFPRLGGNYVGQQVPSPARQLESSGTMVGRRKRGRPKGSKGATKLRPDKDRKGPLTKPPQNTDSLGPADVPDESWVDVEQDSMDVTDDVDANVLLLAQATSATTTTPRPQKQQQQLEQAQSVTSSARSLQATSTPIRTALPPASNAAVATSDLSAAKRRGRPKGSKNRPKETPAGPVAGPGTASHGASSGSRASQLPSPVAQRHNGSGASQAFTPVNTSVAMATTKQAVNSKGSVTELHQAQPDQVTSRSSQGAGGEARSFTAAKTALSTKSPTSASASTQQRQTNVQQVPQTATVSQAKAIHLSTPPAASRAAGQKRKRAKPAKDDDNAQQDVANSTHQSGASPQVNGLTLPTASNHPNSRPQEVSMALQTPPAKRSRKGKNPKHPADIGEPAQLSTGANDIATAATPLVASGPVPNESSVSNTATSQISHRPEPSQISSSVGGGTSMSSVQSPHQSHYEVPSPTMENYEAQLKAQLEQEAEVDSHVVAHQPRADPTQLAAPRLQHQQQYHQRQSPQQYPQQTHHQQQHTPTNHNNSPNLQVQSTKLESATSLASQQQQTRAAQGKYNQYRNTPTSQYTQSQQAQKLHHSSQTQQQAQYIGQQQHGQGTQTTPTHQYSANTTQQQSTSNQQPYPTNQQQYSNGGHQQHNTQPRYQQQLATSSANTTTYSAHQPVQFGTSVSNSYTTTADGTYRTSGSSLSAAPYGQRSQSATPSAAASFRTSSAHNMSRQSPSYNAGGSTVQHRSASASHPTTQSMQGMAGTMQTFPGNTTTSWDMFDTGHLDASGHQAALALSNANYGMNATTIRTPNNNSSAFTATSLASFDTSGLSGNDRFFGVQRR
ncbi:hypothetical protein QBC35DRAFT_205134 [Podospora australis]|uniref:Uncharacterized protein n=1 Tax=Podospora australis TaxID=1536484 RepID=A0AAN7AIC3_9PEZI|nr:hypothetical protein QBC35DRAFT_205134 [Podospora australis]